MNKHKLGFKKWYAMLLGATIYINWAQALPSNQKTPSFPTVPQAY